MYFVQEAGSLCLWEVKRGGQAVLWVHGAELTVCPSLTLISLSTGPPGRRGKPGRRGEPGKHCSHLLVLMLL